MQDLPPNISQDTLVAVSLKHRQTLMSALNEIGMKCQFGNKISESTETESVQHFGNFRKIPAIRYSTCRFV